MPSDITVMLWCDWKFTQYTQIYLTKHHLTLPTQTPHYTRPDHKAWGRTLTQRYVQKVKNTSCFDHKLQRTQNPHLCQRFLILIIQTLSLLWLLTYMSVIRWPMWYAAVLTAWNINEGDVNDSVDILGLTRSVDLRIPAFSTLALRIRISQIVM